jgi:tRNA1(Val) A37 N6-methylase TrmN6
MAEAPEHLSDEWPEDKLTRDAWLGGRLTLIQPRGGHRIGSDAAVLAAAADPAHGRIVDVGAGVGAVGLALISRNERLAADLIEIDSGLARLADANAARNGLAERVRILPIDIHDARARREADLADDGAEAVVTNPPFFDSRAVRASSDTGKDRAHVFPADGTDATPLIGWIRASLAILKPGGRFTMIHRPEALGVIVEAAENRLGAVTVLPVFPREGASAHRLLVSGIKGSRAPLRIAPALILHQADGRLTEEADAIHRGEALLDWGV